MGQTSLDMKSHHQQQHSQQREVEHNSSARELMAAAQLNRQQQHQEEEGGVQQQLVRPPEHSPAYMEHSLYPADKKGEIPWTKQSLHVRSQTFLITLRLEPLWIDEVSVS